MKRQVTPDEVLRYLHTLNSQLEEAGLYIDRVTIDRTGAEPRITVTYTATERPAE